MVRFYRISVLNFNFGRGPNNSNLNLMSNNIYVVQKYTLLYELNLEFKRFNMHMRSSYREIKYEFFVETIVKRKKTYICQIKEEILLLIISKSVDYLF